MWKIIIETINILTFLLFIVNIIMYVSFIPLNLNRWYKANSLSFTYKYYLNRSWWKKIWIHLLVLIHESYQYIFVTCDYENVKII